MFTICFNSAYTDTAKKEMYEMFAREKRMLENYCEGHCNTCDYRELCRDLSFVTVYLKEKLDL